MQAEMSLFIWQTSNHTTYFFETILPPNAANLPSLKGCTGFQPTNLQTDDLVLDELIRVSHIIGSRAALVGNNMSLCGLYHTTIYQWINHVGVCEDYAFLLSYGQNDDRH